MIELLILQYLLLFVTILLAYNATLTEKTVKQFKELHDMQIRILNARIDNLTEKLK